MTGYAPPIADMMFALQHAAGLDEVATLPGADAAAADVLPQVLQEAGKLASEVIAPLNVPADRAGSVLENGVVRTPAGFKAAYDSFVSGGWNALPFDPEFGGQGAPWAVALPVQEMWQAACLSFGLLPMLGQGAVELLQAHGSPEQKRRYLPKLVSGEWTGTMNLTEPQAGSDLGQIRTRAVPDGGQYRVFGQKIFITYGDHDLAENIVHLVLARLPDAPAGTRGISLFIVPKRLLDTNGGPGPRNDLRVVSLEHKLGIKASPTAVMAYGDSEGAVGELVGEPHRGLEYMFTMMNNARLSVGLQGVAIAERAYQHARDYARARIQSRAVGERSGEPVPIVRHPDVRRMLLTMRALTEAGRCLVYAAAAALDIAKRHPDAARRAESQLRADLLTPVAKAWCTDQGIETASLGIQVHGGMGFIEEAGAAQHLRDARITAIYEGTNGIQANDLVFRKLGRDGGGAARACIADFRGMLPPLRAAGGADAVAIGDRVASALSVLETATGLMVERQKADPPGAAAVAVAYLDLFGRAAGGALLARSATAALAALARGEGDRAFLAAKVGTARFFADHVLSRAPALADLIAHGAPSVLSFAEESL